MRQFSIARTATLLMNIEMAFCVICKFSPHYLEKPQFTDLVVYLRQIQDVHVGEVIQGLRQ